MAIDEQRAADRRKPRGKAIIAARVRRLSRTEVPAAEGVVPLNPGFFAVEQMRSGSGAKARAKKSTKARG